MRVSGSARHAPRRAQLDVMVIIMRQRARSSDVMRASGCASARGDLT